MPAIGYMWWSSDYGNVAAIAHAVLPLVPVGAMSAEVGQGQA